MTGRDGLKHREHSWAAFRHVTHQFDEQPIALTAHLRSGSVLFNQLLVLGRDLSLQAPAQDPLLNTSRDG